MAETIAKAIDMATAPLCDRILALEQRCGALERQPRGLQYCGVWTEGHRYAKGDVVTDAGSMCAALANSVTSRPTDDPGSWQLCVKRGKDGRDAR
jgi:hypothetical protein